MTLGDKFRIRAQATIHKFSIGTYTYIDSAESYDVETGVVTLVPTETEAPAARYNAKDQITDATYDEEWCVIAMAGLDLGGVIPSTGNLIRFPDGSEHRILGMNPDQYGACYFLHVAEEPWQ